MDKMLTLMAHAVGQCGRDRFYTVEFDDGPCVRVYENLEPGATAPEKLGEWIRMYWMGADSVIFETRPE
jgi:hypothetical protein